MQKIYALLDCNNFYASCEKVFNPALANEPIAILSNNDGCIISRSAEAKALEVPMGSPWFKVKQELAEKGVKVLSSNYVLYGDMSHRVMEILEEYTHELEIYSIDEAFFNLTGLDHLDLTEYGREIKGKIKMWLGLPVTIGIGSTKTLAKLANTFSKKHKEVKGVLNLHNNPDVDEILKQIPIGDVWGVGFRNKSKYTTNGIYNAKQLKYADDKWILKKFTKMGLKTVWELRGTVCSHHDEIPSIKKGICTSRSFGKRVTELHDLKEAVSDYVSTCAIKLRRQNSAAKVMLVYLRSHKFKDRKNYYSAKHVIKMPQPTADTLELIKYAKLGIEKLYVKGYNYKKAGIILTDFISIKDVTNNMFEGEGDTTTRLELMDAIDKLNSKHGRRKVRIAAVGVKQDWWMKSEHRSPDYTTDWKQLPVVKA